MSTTTISSRGRITLPAALLRERRMTSGTQLEVIATSTAIVLMTIDQPIAGVLAGRTGGIYGDPAEYLAQERNKLQSRAKA